MTSWIPFHQFIRNYRHLLTYHCCATVAKEIRPYSLTIKLSFLGTGPTKGPPRSPAFVALGWAVGVLGRAEGAGWAAAVLPCSVSTERRSWLFSLFLVASVLLFLISVWDVSTAGESEEHKISQSQTSKIKTWRVCYSASIVTFLYDDESQFSYQDVWIVLQVFWTLPLPVFRWQSQGNQSHHPDQRRSSLCLKSRRDSKFHWLASTSFYIICLSVCSSHSTRTVNRPTSNLVGVLMITRGCALSTFGAVWTCGPPAKLTILTQVIISTVTVWRHSYIILFRARTIHQIDFHQQQQQLHRGETVVHVHSENSVHHFVTADKCFLKMKHSQGQCVNETRGFDQSISTGHTSQTGTVLEN